MLLVLLALGLAWIYVEHRVHLFGVLPYLFLLACPFMHVFMHHGHGHRHGAEAERDGGGS